MSKALESNKNLYSECEHVKRRKPDIRVTEEIAKEIGSNYRTLPVFEKGLYDHVYVQHYSLQRHELLRCRWLQYKRHIEERVFAPFQFPCPRSLLHLNPSSSVAADTLRLGSNYRTLPVFEKGLYDHVYVQHYSLQRHELLRCRWLQYKRHIEERVFAPFQFPCPRSLLHLNPSSSVAADTLRLGSNYRTLPVFEKGLYDHVYVQHYSLQRHELLRCRWLQYKRHIEERVFAPFQFPCPRSLLHLNPSSSVAADTLRLGSNYRTLPVFEKGLYDHVYVQHYSLQRHELLRCRWLQYKRHIEERVFAPFQFPCPRSLLHLNPSSSVAADTLRLGSNYRTLPVFEKGLYDHVYVQHYSLQRHELLRCRWLQYKRHIEERVFAPFQFPCPRSLLHLNPSSSVAADTLRLGSNYRTLPVFEKGLYDHVYVQHYSLQRHELLRCRWLQYKRHIEERVFAPFQFPCPRDLHFYNGCIRFLPSESIYRFPEHRMKLRPGPGVDFRGQMPIPQELLMKRGKTGGENGGKVPKARKEKKTVEKK